MINGLIFFEDGGVQPLGQLTKLGDLIRNIEAALPQLRQQEIQIRKHETKQTLEQLSLEELQEELKRRK